VTDYSQYGAKNAEAGAVYEKTGGDDGVSLETTHGLIYAAARDASNQTDPPFLFVSGVVVAQLIAQRLES